LDFQRGRNHLKNQCLPHSESKSYQINSIKSCSSRSFQQYRFLWNFQLGFSLIFSEEIIQYSKNFNTASPNAMKPSPCTPPPPGELSKETKNTQSKASLFSGSHKYKIKQTNNLPS
jgi:hypothetical protein